MVQLLRREPVTEYELRDANGRSIGQVIAPVGATDRPGAATVLLIRHRRRTTCAEVSSAA